VPDLFRVFLYLARAANKAPGGALYLPHQGAGRIDNPSVYSVLYASDAAAGALAEALAAFPSGHQRFWKVARASQAAFARRRVIICRTTPRFATWTTHGNCWRSVYAPRMSSAAITPVAAPGHSASTVEPGAPQSEGSNAIRRLPKPPERSCAGSLPLAGRVFFSLPGSPSEVRRSPLTKCNAQRT